jgi:hypothetical protein
MSTKRTALIDRAKPEWTRAFFAPLALRHIPTEREYMEFGNEVDELAESLFSNIEGFEYENFKLLDSALSVYFLASNPNGERKFRAVSAHPLQFRDRFSHIYLNPLPVAIREPLFSAVESVWDSLVRDFRWLAREGRLEIFARANSPTAPFKEVAPDAFEHFEMVEWERGVAESSSGERLFSVHAQRPTNHTPLPPAARERSKPRLDPTKAMIMELWGDPPDRIAVPDGDLIVKVSKAAKDRGLSPIPSRDTILRAANRATDRRQRK